MRSTELPQERRPLRRLGRTGAQVLSLLLRKIGDVSFSLHGGLSREPLFPYDQLDLTNCTLVRSATPRRHLSFPSLHLGCCRGTSKGTERRGASSEGPESVRG